MKRAVCLHEDATTRAARSGEWNSFLKKHVDECAACREVVETSRWMQALAQDPALNHDSHDASLLWWRAQLSEKQAQAERAQSVLEWTEIVVACAMAVALAGWAAWNWALLQVAADWLETGLSPQTWIAAYSGESSFWSAFSVLLLAALLVAYPILAEE